jgi:hypothetical protein
VVTDHRSVPLEVLRELARSEAELSSIRIVAEDAGVGRSTLHNFIARGTMPHPRVRRLLALWYLRRLSGVSEMELLRPYASALDVLLADVPEEGRARVLATLLDGVQRECADGGEGAPQWVDALRRRWSLSAPVHLVRS